jgi:hypothetical protein
MSINSISIWIKELSSRPFIERVGESKNSENETCRELWTYIPKTNSYRIPLSEPGPYRRPVPKQKKGMKK